MRRSDSNEILFPVDKISVKLKHQSQRRNDLRFETDPSPTQLPTGTHAVFPHILISAIFENKYWIF